MYAYIYDETIRELIPDIDPVFPETHISERYDEEFLSHLEHFEDNKAPAVGMVRQEDGSWAYPPVPDIPPAEPTFEELQEEINLDMDYRLTCLELGI